MKKKVTTYVLLTLCIVIWGTIGWKVYSALQDDTPVPVRAAKVAAVPPKETPSLLLNYRDPFLGGYPQQKVKTEKASPEPVVERREYAEPPQTEVVPDFQYKGIIRFGKMTQAIINRNGESLMLKANEKVGEFNVVQITEAKLVVSRKNKKYELSVQ